jgi:ribosomal-protein-alanine N-acetyltransferase
VVVRHLLPQDIDSAMGLVSETFSELFAADMYAAIQQAWPAGQLVEVDPSWRLSGLLLAIKRSAFSARILVMAVREDARGRGSGSQLLRLFLRQCLVEGIQEVVLEVRVSNLRAQSFYGRAGFVRAGTLPRYYRDGEDGYVMARRMT